MTQELRKLAEAAKGWLIRPSIVQETEDDILKLGDTSEDGEFYEQIEIDCENYGQPSRPLAEFIAAANPAAILALWRAERDAYQQAADKMAAEHKVERDALQAENERLKALSVQNIMLDVIPGDGSGLEVYAKSVDAVVQKLTDMSARLEDWELGIKRHPALAAQLDAIGKGEAVAGTVEILLEAAEVLDKVRSQCDDAWERFGLRDYLPDELHGTALIVRDAAPKALEPSACSDFAKEYLAAWDDGMAGDSYLRRMAEAALKCDGITKGTP